MRRVDLLLLGLGVASASLHVGMTFVSQDLGAGLELGELVTLLLAPLVVPGLAWSVWGALRLQSAGPTGAFRAAAVLLGVGALWYATGVGLNLGANAIARQVGPDGPEELRRLTYLLDERLGHWLWHAGAVAIAFGLAATVSPARPADPGWRLAALGGLLFGFTWFADAVEGQTVPFMLPASGLLLAVVSGSRRRRGPVTGSPVVIFLLVAAAVALALFLTWGAWHGGFPEFSRLGWI